MALAIWWGTRDWDWSTIDDPGHALLLRQRIEELGLPGGMLQYGRDLFEIDRTWALFRPSYWVCPSFFYLLPVGLAHVVRLAMVVVAIAGPLVFLRRHRASMPRLAIAALVMLGASSTLYLGLFFLSLQELSGAACIGLGLLVRRRWARVVWWTIAAWFKAPFAWLLVGEAIALWRRGERRLAVVSGVLGVGTLATAAVVARGGSYTSQYRIDPYLMMDNWPKLLEPMNSLLLVALVWWLVVTRASLRASALTIAVGIGFVGYTGQLLPWGVTAYYMGAISYLFGLLLISVLTDPDRVSMRRLVVGLSLPAVIAAYLVWTPVSQGLRTNAVIDGIGDCLVERPGSKTLISGSLIYVTTSPEGPFRIVQNLALRDPRWAGDIANDDEARTGLRDPSVTHYAVIAPAPAPEGRAATPVCGNTAVTVFDVGGTA